MRGWEGAVIESWLCVSGWELVIGCVASWLAWLFMRFWANEPPLGAGAPLGACMHTHTCIHCIILDVARDGP